MKSFVARIAVGSVVVATSFVSKAAHAEPSPEDRALATDLFRRGRELLTAGRTAEACEKLEASQRLDPSGGTILNLALCHEGLGRTATAWSEFGEALSMAKRDHREDRARFAAEHLAALEPRLSRLTVLVDDPARDIVVRRDGSELPRAAWQTPTPIDPGLHVVEAHAEGRVPFRIEVTVGPFGDRQTVTVRTNPLPRHQDETPRVLAGVFGVSAVAAVAVGSVAGVHALALRRSSDQLCGLRCTEDAVDRNERAKIAADVSTVAFVVAGVAVTAALYFFFTTRHPKPEPAAIVRF